MDNEDLKTMCDEFEVPLWFIRSAIVEYLECRDYSEYPGFNFDHVATSDVRGLLKSGPLVVTAPPVIANVHPDTYKSRMISALSGRPATSIASSEDGLIPEGTTERLRGTKSAVSSRKQAVS
ncbi:hypothetical protein [Caballeronia sp. LZ028]|uniref:hypothetical protein n=1 Tax=Caballeronia sp. LZ028 TaxID=3038563 RepID=UPI00285DA6FF|nr:hypothetical protein [Caballeronia sp. LZ028]MDR5769666.1 hypothetical protein [Caballeronia sp. LZ028]